MTISEHTSLSLGSTGKPLSGEDIEGITLSANNSQKFTEIINIETHEHLADKIREKESKYQFTMSASNKEELTKMSYKLTTFLETEKDHSKLLAVSKKNKVTDSTRNEVQSSDETDENQSKSESEPKSGKSFVGKISQKVFGAFKKDEKGKSKKKKEKKKKQKAQSNKNQESVEDDIEKPSIDQHIEPNKQTVDEVITNASSGDHSHVKVKTDKATFGENENYDIKSQTILLAQDLKGKIEGTVNEKVISTSELVKPNHDQISLDKVGCDALLPSDENIPHGEALPVSDDTPILTANKHFGIGNIINCSSSKEISSASMVQINIKDEEKNVIKTTESPKKSEISISNLASTVTNIQGSVSENLEIFSVQETTNEKDKKDIKCLVTGGIVGIDDVDSSKKEVNEINDLVTDVKYVVSKTVTFKGAPDNIVDEAEGFEEDSAQFYKEINDNTNQVLIDSKNKSIDLIEKPRGTLTDKSLIITETKLGDLASDTNDKLNDIKKTVEVEKRENTLNLADSKSIENNSNRKSLPLDLCTSEPEKNTVDLSNQELDQKTLMAEKEGNKVKGSDLGSAEGSTTDKPSSPVPIPRSIKTTNNKIKSFFGGLFGKSNEMEDDVGLGIQSALPDELKKETLQDSSNSCKSTTEETCEIKIASQQKVLVPFTSETKPKVDSSDEKSDEGKLKSNLSLDVEKSKQANFPLSKGLAGHNIVITEATPDVENNGNSSEKIGFFYEKSESLKKELENYDEKVTHVVSKTFDSIESDHLVKATETVQNKIIKPSHEVCLSEIKVEQNITVEEKPLMTVKYLPQAKLQSKDAGNFDDNINPLNVTSRLVCDPQSVAKQQISNITDLEQISEKEIDGRELELGTSKEDNFEAVQQYGSFQNNVFENIQENVFSLIGMKKEKAADVSKSGENLVPEDLKSDISLVVDNFKQTTFSLNEGSAVQHNENPSLETTHESTNNDDDKLNNMLIDMLIEQECMKIPSENVAMSHKQNIETPNLPEKCVHTIQEEQSETVESSELRAVHSFGRIESLISDSDLKKIPVEEKPSDKPYVTTPTMQRRKIGGSQRLSREERPTLREISHLSDYSSSDEEASNRYIVTEPTDQSSTRKVSFHVESEDETCLKVSNSSSESDIYVKEMTPSPIPTVKGHIEISREESSKIINDQILITDNNRKIKKVDQRFERMASETLETDPEVKFTADKEFQRMVSQLSAEEVEACISQWDEEGMTPSEEQDSSNTTAEGDLGPDIEALPEEVSKDVTREHRTSSDADISLPKPCPRPTKQETQDESLDPQKSNEDMQDYSVRKRFWEQMSSGSQDSQRSQDTTTPPVPKPRSSIVSSTSLLKSEAESDTETTGTTLSDSTVRIKNLQQDAVSKQSFTGSSDASDKEEASETEALETKRGFSSVLTTAVTVVSHTVDEPKSRSQIGATESSASEAEYIAKVGEETLAYENTGFIPDEDTDSAENKENKFLEKSRLDKLEYSNKSTPVAATRKSHYERSVSLPTEDITDVSINSVKAKKRFFEAQIKKEMVVDQLMTQLEEEASPEHKSFHHSQSDVPTSDPEIMMSRQIHSHIFSHELEEQIESLVPEDKHISEKTQEVETVTPPKVKEIVSTFDKVDAKKCVKRTDSKSYEAEVVQIEEFSKEVTDEFKVGSRQDQHSVESYAGHTEVYEHTIDFDGIVISGSENQFIEDVEDMIKYRSDSISKPSDSLEVHIDKSEIEESEKEMEIDEELKQLEESLIQKSKPGFEESDDGRLPEITITQSSKQRPDSYSQGESEDTQSESDITPEDLRDKEVLTKLQDWEQEVLVQRVDVLDKNESQKSPSSKSPHVHTPEEHIPDTVWEVPIQQEPESSEQEIVEDIPIGKQPLLEKDEEESQRSLTESCEMKSEILQPLGSSSGHRLSDNESSLTESALDLKGSAKEQIFECKMTEEEARQIAQEIVENIEVEISKRQELLTDITDETNISETVKNLGNTEVSDYIKRLTGKEDLEVKLIESVLAKKQREQIIKLSRTDTTTSSIEITDEDLRSSGVETDISPLESQGSRLYPVEDHAEDDSLDDILSHEKDIDVDIEKIKKKEVVEKTLAEVKESLEAAQDELIEEQKKKKEVHKKPSPSEFEFKTLTLEKFSETYIEECHAEESTASTELKHLGEDKQLSVTSEVLLKEKEIGKDESRMHVEENIQFHKSKDSETLLDSKELELESIHSSQKETDVVETVIEKQGTSKIKSTQKGSHSYSSDEEKSTHVKASQQDTVYSDGRKTSKSLEDKERDQLTKEEGFTYCSTREEWVEGQHIKIEKNKKEERKFEKFDESSLKKEEMTVNIDEEGFMYNTSIEKSKRASKSIFEVKEESHTESQTQSCTMFSTDTDDDVQQLITQGILKTEITDSDKEESVTITRNDEIKRTYSEESQKSSQDESIKSQTGIDGGISSSSSSGKKEDSDAMHTLGQPEVVMRKRKNDKSASQKRSDRRSGTDYEPYSSSGESYYHSFEQTSESIRTPSRPCSSDVDALIAGVGTTGSSEYESAISHEITGRSLTSYEYHTAVSSLSSRESMKSLDSESSGNLASVEISSEASETLVPSAMELDSDMDGLVMHMIEEDSMLKQKAVLEPYDQDIPHHIIKGESPPIVHTISDVKYDTRSASLDISSEGGISEEDGEVSLNASRDEDVLDKSSRMKRSHEMTFQPEPRPITFDNAGSESFSQEEKYGSSLDDTVSVLSLSSTSDTAAIRTVIERSRTESEKMDGSANSDQLSLTVSGTSEQISLSSVCDDINIQLTVTHETIATQSSSQDTQVDSVLLMTSSVNKDGVQSVCTQVTSHAEIPPTKIDEIVEDGYTCSNGPTQVEYNAEYDDVKEIRKRPGHRRNESTSFKPSSIPIFNKRSIVETKVQKGTLEYNDDVAESDKYEELSTLTVKEDRNNEKKDVDEAEKVYEESYQTEADQGFHRDMREARQAFEEMSSLEEEHEELQNIEESRPQSQISKSDSESGQRPMSSGFSDDRPDSELAELLKQCSSEVCSEDPIERPKTPEPSEDCEIKDDTPEFSSEAQTSVTELELEYSGAFSRTLEYEAHVSPIREKISSQWEHPISDHEEELAEAEAAFQMVPHVTPHLSGVPLPDTIMEDPIAEKHELETREMALKEEIRKRAAQIEATSPGSIPDITVTQHMTPLIDRGFHYPDLELEEASVKASAPQTPASISSRASSETETDQGREYVLIDDVCDDLIAEEPDIGESSVTTEEKTVFESKDDRQERDSATDSPTSDSFEMLEKPDIADEFVIIEEVGKEAHEQDREGKSMTIGKKRVIKKVEDADDEVVVSPPAPVTRMTEIKYYPEGGATFPFDSDSPPTNVEGVQSGEATSQEGSPPSDTEHEYESEVEAGKKWIEMQFQGDQATAVYGYELDYERGPLEDIKEEPDLENNSSRFGSLGSQVSQSAGSFGSMKESFSSTPDYDVLAGRKYFTRSGDHDDVSMSSLQEFERLENLIAMEINRNKSSGSQDSLNSSGNSKRHTGSGKSGGDDVSLASLKEFEGLEHACIEAARIELKAKEEEAALLSEIEEGHESQASESESCETISAVVTKGAESDEEDYEKRMFEIDEIIRQAQTNVERFVDVKEKDSLTESSVIEKTESMGRGDSIEEVSKIPDLDLDQPLYSLATASVTHRSGGSTIKQSKEKENEVVTSVGSKHYSDNLTTSSDSLEMRVASEKDLMSASTDSIEFQAQQKKLKTKDIMTDSIEVVCDKTSMLTSTDSLETDLPKHFSDSIDDEDGCHTTGLQDQSSSSGRDGDFSFSSKDDFFEQNRMPPPRAELLLGSTDSLEPSSSTATHATYHCETDSVMSSSFTSGGSNTLMSSTETLDTGMRTAVWFDENKPYVTEVIEPCEEGTGFVHTIHRTVEMPPEIHNVTFRGPDADKALKEYIEQFGPGENMTETQEIDAAGNIHTMRVIQKRVVMKPDEFKGHSSRFSEAELDEYLKQTYDERIETGDSQTETHTTFTTSPTQPSFSHHTVISRHITPHSLKQELTSTQVKGESTGEDTDGSPSTATARETDEALLDLAAGLQDNKGGGAGVGPSSK